MTPVEEILHDLSNIRSMCGYLREFGEGVSSSELLSTVIMICDRMASLAKKIENQIECGKCQDLNNT